MLRACNRVLEPGGLLAYLVITDRADLPPREAGRVLETGVGPAVSGDVYAELTASAGFDGIEVEDVTGTYEEVLAGWIREWDAERSEMERLAGKEAFAERRQNRVEDLASIRAGTRHRYLVTASRR